MKWSGIYPFSVCSCTLLKCHPISVRPHFAILAGSSNFLCILSPVQIIQWLSVCVRNVSTSRLYSLQPLTQWPRVRCVTAATAASPQPQWRTPGSANSIWSYLPSSHSAESVSVSGGVSKDHYHILSMSSFMAPVYSSARAEHRL